MMSSVQLSHDEIENIYEDLKIKIHSMRDKLNPSLDVASFESSDVGRTHLSVMLLNCDAIHKPSQFERELDDWQEGTQLYSENVGSFTRYSVEVPIAFMPDQEEHHKRRRHPTRTSNNTIMYYVMGAVVSASYIFYKVKVGEAPQAVLDLF